MTTAAQDKRLLQIVADRSDWLVDAVATATQNRALLSDENTADHVLIEAIRANGAKAIQTAVVQILEEIAPTQGPQQ